MSNGIYIVQHCASLKLKAAVKYNIAPEKVHIGHLLLQSMLQYPDQILQIDAATNQSETNISVAKRSMRLASAMKNYGLQPGDTVIISGFNHLDLCIPVYACHFNGYSMCGIDPDTSHTDFKKLFPNLKPKVVFCQKFWKEMVQNEFKTNNLKGEVICFDDYASELEDFINVYKGNEVNFRLAEFDDAKINAWLMLTSGTTGLPKVAMFPYKTVLNGIYSWWQPFPYRFKRVLCMPNLHWLTAYIYYLSGPLRCFTRVQCSTTQHHKLSAASLINVIQNYKPDLTAGSPSLLYQLVMAAEQGLCDISCFKYITIGGGRVPKPLLVKFKKLSSAWLHLVYGMTELLAPVFEFNDDVPVGSVGYQTDKYRYKLIEDNENVVDKPQMAGELWIKGDDFFQGYLNNPEETRKMISDDGWVKTGDVFYRDEQDFYYYVERKRLLIRRGGLWIPPLLLEEVIKQHPGVVEACVVGIPDPDLIELATAAILRRNGDKVEPKEIFDLLKETLPKEKQLTGGLFFVDSFPITPSGKINRSKLREIAISSIKIMPV